LDLIESWRPVTDRPRPEEIMMMRIRTAVVLCVLAAVGTGGCGGKGQEKDVATAGGTVTPSGSATVGEVDGKDMAVKYSQCMRANGVPNFPDPDVGGRISMDGDKLGVSRERMEEAAEKCRQFTPNGGEPQKLDPEKLEQARKYSKCMRENGVPNFPDPDESGGVALDPDKLGMDPQDARVKAANEACVKYLGTGDGRGEGESGTNG
jgi:hypothetical protein